MAKFLILVSFNNTVYCNFLTLCSILLFVISLIFCNSMFLTHYLLTYVEDCNCLISSH